MADPNEIARTVAGLVSLGIQLHGTLKLYLDDFNPRDKPVARTLRDLEHFRQSLHAVEAERPILENEHSVPSGPVVSCLEGCKAELESLAVELRMHISSSPTDFKGAMKDAKRRLKSPIESSDLDKMSRQLEQASNILSQAIDVLNL
jgi:hypothetical protein